MVANLGSLAGSWPGCAVGFAGVLLASALVGCEVGDADVDGLTEDEDATTATFCAAMCKRAVECGGWSSARPCERECLATQRLGDFRSVFIAKYAACFQRLSCTDFFMESAFAPCWDEARAELEPNLETRAFCTERSRTWFECGYWYFTDECERDWALRAGVSLDRVAVCHESAACDELGSCTEAALAAGR